MLKAAANELSQKLDFGRTQSLRKLFDYLIDRSLHGEAASEADVATVVLGKKGIEAVLDASARVVVFRLRKKLEAYYDSLESPPPYKLVLPRGEYRLQLVQNAPSDTPDLITKPAVPLRVKEWKKAALFAGTLFGGLALGLLLKPSQEFSGEQRQLRATAAWETIVQDDRPTTLVAGDYYILGELDEANSDPARLVREYAINSREDLDQRVIQDPSLKQKYVDLSLFYLPASAGGAIHAISSTLGISNTHHSRDDFVTTSSLTPNIMKSNNLIYVGLLSGMGLLQPIIFTESRIEFAGSYDALVDQKTGQLYTSEPPEGGLVPRRNFAYIASLPGPSGNRILVIAGTRDAALLEAALLATSPTVMEQLSAISPHGYFEALYEVDGPGPQNLKSKLITVEARE